MEELRRTERLHDLRTGFGSPAAVEQSSAGMAPGLVRVILPPYDAVASNFVHRGGAAGGREAEVHPQLANGSFRIAAVEDDPSSFILIESKMNKTAEEVSGLRVALARRRGDPRSRLTYFGMHRAG